MPVFRILFIIAGFLVVGWSIYTVIHPSTQQEAGAIAQAQTQVQPATSHTTGKNQDRDISQLRDSVSKLRSEIISLQHQLKAIHEQMAQMRLAIRQSVAEASEVPIVREQSRELSEAEHEETVARMIETDEVAFDDRLATIETTLQQESVDAQWSGHMRTELGAVLDDLKLNKDALVDLQCRKTLCRIELFHESQDRVLDLEPKLTQRMIHHLPNFAIHHFDQDDGSVITVVYGARQDYDLPQVQSDG